MLLLLHLFFIISVITLIKPSPSVLCLVVLRHLLTFAPIMTHHRTYASKYIPIIASVSEHQPPTWPSYFMDINVLAFLVPAGIIVSSGCQTHIYACVYWHSLPFLSSIVLFADMFWTAQLYAMVFFFWFLAGLLFATIWCKLLCGPLHSNISVFFWSHGKYIRHHFTPPTFLHLLHFSFMVIIDFWFALQVRLMLVLAPAACITSGIALSAAFEVFTRSIKFQLPELSGSSLIDVIILSSLFICNNLLTVWWVKIDLLD